MRTLTATIAIAILALTFIGCGASRLSDSVETALLGDWRSTALEGSASGDFISSIEFSFRDASELSATATMTDGSVDTKSGTWSVENDRLTMTFDGEAQTSKIDWRNGLLVINDHEIDSRVILKKEEAGRSKKEPQATR